MANVPRGGAATINGILYQMLWSLMSAVRMRLTDPKFDEHDRPIKALLVLEPVGGGGDLQQIEGVSRIVEQLKADSRPGSWSLTRVVRDVLPDLYLAIDDRFPDTTYRFVTEGRMGRWSSAYDFFRSLGNKTHPEGDVLAGLDNATSIFHPQRPSSSDDELAVKSADAEPSFWEEKSYTERTLFERIVKEVRQRTRVKDEEPELSRRKLWRLLGRFDFCENQTVSRVKNEIDLFLREVIDGTTNLEDKRSALLVDLASRATEGSASIEAGEFFAQHKLNATRLSDLATLRLASYKLLQRRLSILGYNAAADVRKDRIKSIVAQWTADKPVLVIKGESGQGKSWLLFGIALELAVMHGSVVLVESRGDAHADQRMASDIYWQEIKGNNGSMPLNRLAASTRQNVKGLPAGWLSIGIDGVRSVVEARSLAMEDWEGRRMKLAISCTPKVAEAVLRDRDGNNFPIMEKKNCVGTMTSAPEGLGSIARGGLPPLVSRSRRPQRIMSPGRFDGHPNEPPP